MRQSFEGVLLPGSSSARGQARHTVQALPPENSLAEEDVQLYQEALLALKGLLDWQPQLLGHLLAQPSASLSTKASLTAMSGRGVLPPLHPCHRRHAAH